MDVKSMAKSKRSHSQHLKKSHQRPNPSSSKTIPTPTGNNAQKHPSKVPNQQVRNVSQKLPSNWTRYDEEEEEKGDEKLDVVRAGGSNEIVKPKSKGADYRELISQALSNSGDSIYDGGRYSLGDTLLLELEQSFGPMLTIRGLGIKSWTADDNFIVDDKGTTVREAPLFSLNLKTLAEQLENVDLPQRLFIEADILPPEMASLYAKESKANRSKECERVHTKVDEELISRTHGEMNFTSISEEGNTTEYDRKATSSDLLTDQAHENDGGAVEPGQSSLLTFSANINSDSVKYPGKKSSLFQAADCEAELDMLLESFSQTDLTSSSGFQENQPTATSYDLHKGTTVLQPQFNREAVVSSKITTSSVKIDDALDELLADTSHLMHQNNTGYHELKNGSVNSIDDHLEETLSLVNQHGASSAHKFRANPPEIKSSGFSVSGSKSKLLEDFDAWMDTI